MKLITLTFAGFKRYAKTTRRAEFLAQMDRVIPWRKLCALGVPAYPMRIVGVLSVGMMILLTSIVHGQTYPSKPIRIVTYTVGGGTDFVARLVAQGLLGLGQPVIVDNRVPIVAGELVSKAPPDGYTLLVAAGVFWIGSLLQNVPYDPVRDFAPISLTTRASSILVVHPSVPVKSVKDLIALAKAKPGELNYGSSGLGTSNHLAAELFRSMAGINIMRINYKGSTQALNDLIGGQVQLMFAPVTVTPHLKSGRLRALAVTSAQPSPLFPGLPTIAAAGLPSYEFASVDAVFAPSKTPAAIIDRLNQEIVRFFNTMAVKEQMLSTGSEVIASSPEELAAAVKSEMTRLGKLIKDIGIKTD